MYRFVVWGNFLYQDDNNLTLLPFIFYIGNGSAVYILKSSNA